MIEQASGAERAGFTGLWLSDHYHPWVDAQGQSAFVWSTIGALSQVCGLEITTAVKAAFVCGNDPEQHLQMIDTYAKAA